MVRLFFEKLIDFVLYMNIISLPLHLGKYIGSSWYFHCFFIMSFKIDNEPVSIDMMPWFWGLGDENPSSE